MAYPPYDAYGRPRRQSLGYRPTTPASYYDPMVSKPLYRSGTPASYSSYHDHMGTPYSDPLLHGEVPLPSYIAINI